MFNKKLWLLANVCFLPANIPGAIAASSFWDYDPPTFSSPCKNKGVTSGVGILPEAFKQMDELKQKVLDLTAQLKEVQSNLDAQRRAYQDEMSTAEENQKKTQKEFEDQVKELYDKISEKDHSLSETAQALADERETLKRAEQYVIANRFFSTLLAVITNDSAVYTGVAALSDAVLGHLDITTAKFTEGLKTALELNGKTYDGTKLFDVITRIMTGVAVAKASIHDLLISHYMSSSQTGYASRHSDFDINAYKRSHNYEPLFVSDEVCELLKSVTTSTKLDSTYWNPKNPPLSNYLVTVRDYAAKMFFYKLWDGLIHDKQGADLYKNAVPTFVNEEDVSTFIQNRFAECEIQVKGGATAFDNIADDFD